MRRITQRQVKNERGDTIIEVLICILIVSMVLAGAFASTNKNLQGVRDAQERAQAVKIAESQLELLRVNAGTGNFCFNTSSNGAMQTTSVNAATCYYDRQGVYVTASGSAATSGDIKDLYSSETGVIYKTQITLPASSSTYEIIIKWINTKADLSQLKMYYRVPPT